MDDYVKKLELSDIGYYGKSIEVLTKHELQVAFLELSQQLYECSSTNEHCRILNRVSSGGNKK
jgi:hypothetical protein